MDDAAGKSIKDVREEEVMLSPQYSSTDSHS